MKKSVTLSGIGGVGTILTILTWLIAPVEILEYVMNHPKVIIAIIFLLVILISLLLKLLFDKNKETYKTGNIGNKGWKHSVLIIDDDEGILKLIKDQLIGQDLDIVTIPKMGDYRLAAEFEIIISDIYGCTHGLTATSVLNTIKEKYPYKFIIPMSSEPGAIDQNVRLNIDSDIIPKGDYEKLMLQIEHKVKTFKEKLDNVNEHWENTSKYLIDNKKTEKQIEAIKDNYYHFVCRMQNGL